MSVRITPRDAIPPTTKRLGKRLFVVVGDNQTNIRQRASENRRPLCLQTNAEDQAALRRSATMAGTSGTGSFLHNFHQGRGGGSTGGWKL